MYTYETDDNLRRMALAAIRAENLTARMDPNSTAPKALGYPPTVLLAQWAAESGWGRSPTGQYNYWGIKRYPEQGLAELCPTTEEMTPAQFASNLRADERATLTKVEPLGNGINRYHLSCWFASYTSFDQSVHSYVYFILSNSRYHTAWINYQSTKDPDVLLNGIADAGYATGAGYKALILGISHQSNIAHAVKMARKEVEDNASDTPTVLT